MLFDIKTLGATCPTHTGFVDIGWALTVKAM